MIGFIHNSALLCDQCNNNFSCRPLVNFNLLIYSYLMYWLENAGHAVLH